MLNLKEKENLILKKCREAVMENKSIYIYGAATMGQILCDGLIKENIPVAGFLVDSEFYKNEETYKNVPVFCRDKIEINSDMLFFVAIGDCNEMKIHQLKEKADVLVLDVFSVFEVGGQKGLDTEFINSHQYELEELYNELADDKSREHLSAYFNQKISGDLKYLQNIWEKNQYYDTGIVDLSKINVFVDCGAYDGDSYFSFLKNYKDYTGSEYKGIAYLFEPDDINYDRLSLNCKLDERCRIMKLGAGSKRSRFMFLAGGTGSRIDKSGDVFIEVDSIDNIVGGQADFIKMDIEGNELEALKGAEQTIKKFKPALAICVYHKKEDLITIPQYIKSLCKEYKLYIRAHYKYADELVLYAVI